MNADDKLDRILRADARQAIPEEGFTARVMGALPARAPHRWLRPLLVLGSAALGSALAVLLAPAQINVVQGFLDLALMRGLTLPGAAGLGMAAALLVSAIVLVADTD
jgi:hypothetical protein